MQRVCFLLKVREDRLDEYRERHAAVWPEMLEALSATGWHNYSLFLRGDGLLIGYVESDDLAQAQRAMAATEVNARWQAAMGDLFSDLDVPPDEGFVLLDEVFHLEDQLAAALRHQRSSEPLVADPQMRSISGSASARGVCCPTRDWARLSAPGTTTRLPWSVPSTAWRPISSADIQNASGVSSSIPVIPAMSVNSVLTGPGQTAVTVTPLPRCSV